MAFAALSKPVVSLSQCNARMEVEDGHAYHRSDALEADGDLVRVRLVAGPHGLAGWMGGPGHRGLDTLSPEIDVGDVVRLVHTIRGR